MSPPRPARRSPASPPPRWRRAARSLSALTAAALAAGLLAAAPAAGEPPDPPPYYAIRDARVVTGDGRTLERATVLLADGLIEAVGPDLPIPADAWVVEGEGLTLLPGLIDALTDLGLEPREDAPDGPPGRGGAAPGGRPGGGPEIRGPQDRPATTPWLSAADLLGEDSRVEKWREAGFTAAVTAPDQGLFTGQAAVINLGRGEPREQVVATPVAQRLNFRNQGGRRSYPGSLMGVLSYIEQTFSDTRHHALARALYREDPAGRERPVYDRALEPLEEALDAGLPFLMPGHLGREIDRVLALAESQGVAAVVYGAQGAYERAGRLKAAGVPALVSLDWPEEERDRDPDADTPLRTLAHRRLAVTTPGVLAGAGVPFAFTSDGLSSPSQIFEGLRTAIEAGLGEEAALRALTLGAAEIFGVADRLGTIEVGKIANLVLATAMPWVEDVEVEAVFVDGRKYELRPEEEPGEPPAQDVSGTWKLTLQTPRGSREMTGTLEMKEDGKVTGEITSPRGTRTVEEGRMSGDLLRFKTRQERGGRSMEASWSLTVTEDSATGTMSAGPMSMDLFGERTARAEPRGEGGGEGEGEGPAVSAEDLRRALALYQGPVREMGTFAITGATVWTVAGETLEDGTVVVRDGEIRAVGRDLPIPPGAEVLDAGGGHLIPGIIDAHSHIAVDGGVNEGSLAVTSMVAIEDVLDPDDIAIYRALAGGVTAANVLHGSANPIGGQNAVIKLRWGSDARGLLLAGAPPGIKFALGENPKRSNFRAPGGSERYPATRMGVMDVIRQAFTEARQYQHAWREHEAAVARGERPTPPRRDLRLEALVEILEGERKVHAHCYRADEILQLLRLADELGFRVATLQHVLEGYKVADEIAAHGAGASTFSDWWGYKMEAYDAIPHNAALMTDRGVLVSINSDSAEEMRHLNQEAAKALRWGGLGEVEALRLVTLNPALQLGIADRVGSIEPGKDADLVLYDGHPLSMLSVVQKTFVDGDLYFDREADRERQAIIDEIEHRLLGKEEEDGAEGTEEDAGSAPEPARRHRRYVSSHDALWGDATTTYSCREDS